jgi:hypothetical protein
MTVGVSTVNTADAWLNCIRASGSTRTVVAGTFAKLHTADPGSAGATAAAVGDATRKTFTQAASSSGSIALNGTNPVWTNGGTSETITHISVWDASSAGNFLYSVVLTASQAWVNTNTFTLTSCTVSIAPLAA